MSERKPALKKTESGVLVPATAILTAKHVKDEPQEATGAVFRRSWRRGKVRTPPENQASLEARKKAQRRKAGKRAKRARRKNR